MKVKNKSRWNTGDLIKLTKAVIKWSGLPAPRILEIMTSRSGWVNTFEKPDCGGCASYGGSWVRMKVPSVIQRHQAIGSDGHSRNINEVIEFPSGEYAQTLFHEIGHNTNLRHREMVKSNKIEIPDEIATMIVRQMSDKPKPERNIRQERYNNALDKVREYEKRMKMATTKLKKWQSKVKYYEKIQGKGLEPITSSS